LTSYQVQGTDSKLLSSGTVTSSVGSVLCTDAAGGATTTGCLIPTGLTGLSAGDLPPLFTTTITNPTTVPNVAFNLSNVASAKILGNFTGSSAPWSATGLLAGTNMSFAYNAGANTLTLNAASGSPLLLEHNDSSIGVNQTTLDFNDTTPAAPAGFSQVTFQTDTSGRLSGYVPSNPVGIDMQPLNLPIGQYVLLYPTSATASDSNPPYRLFGRLHYLARRDGIQ